MILVGQTLFCKNLFRAEVLLLIRHDVRVPTAVTIKKCAKLVWDVTFMMEPARRMANASLPKE